MPRPAGTPNKATTKAREAFQALLDGRVEQLQAWIDRVAQDDPHKAFYMVMDLAKYCLPRPAAVTLTEPVDMPPLVVRFFDGTVASCTACGHRGQRNDPQTVS